MERTRLNILVGMYKVTVVWWQEIYDEIGYVYDIEENPEYQAVDEVLNDIQSMIANERRGATLGNKLGILPGVKNR